MKNIVDTPKLVLVPAGTPASSGIDMEAGENGTWVLRYAQHEWGDLIEGTKEQLQALGLGVGQSFPTEPRTALNVHDPRGYSARISKNTYSGRGDLFRAALTFPNWPRLPHATDGLDEWTQCANGLKKRAISSHSDEYIGSVSSLAAAGLVRPEQLPGMPGMRKMRVTIFQDGTTPSGPPTAVYREARLPGARQVERAGAGAFRVRVFLPEDEQQRRNDAIRNARAEYSRQVFALPRPARLTDYVHGIEGRPDDTARAPSAESILNDLVELCGAEDVLRQLQRRAGSNALAAMGMLHRRKLPPGWRVIEGQRHEGAPA